LRFVTRVKALTLVALASFFVSFALCGCDRVNTSSAAPLSADCSAPTTVRETFDCLRQWYVRGSYLAMRPYIDPVFRDDVIDLLIAVDELLAANIGAREAIQKSCPQIDPAMFDMSSLQNEYLDLFSRDVQVVRMEESDGRGTVIVQIGNRMPLTHLIFQQQQERWVYVPGEMTTELAGRLREIAYAWNQLALVVSAKPHLADEVMHEFRLRVQPKLRFE